MALTQEELEKRWQAKRTKGRQQAEDLVAKQRKAAEEAALRRQRNQDAAAGQRKAKEDLARRNREIQEEALRREELQQLMQSQALQQEMADPVMAASPQVSSADNATADIDVHRGVNTQENIGAVPDMQEILVSVDRMDFFDLGQTRDNNEDSFPEPARPIQEVVQKPEDDLADVEDRRARLFAKAQARRRAWDERVKAAVVDAQVSTLAKQLKPTAAAGVPAASQQKPKAAVRMPRRMKIGGEMVGEASEAVQLASSGLSIGGLPTLTAQAVASGARSSQPQQKPSSFSRGSGLSRPTSTSTSSKDDTNKEQIKPEPVRREHFVGVSASGESKHPIQEVPLNARQEEAVHGLEQGALDLSDLDEDLRACRQVVLAALQVDGHALAHAADELRDDREIVLTAVYESGSSIRHAGKMLRRDREVVLAAVMDCGAALEFASAELRGEREVALTAIENDPRAVQFASKALMDDRDFVLAAVQMASQSLQHASARLKQDRTIVLKAVESNPDSFMHAAQELRIDRDFVLAAVRANGCAIAHASLELRRDSEILAAAIANDPLAAASAQD